MTDSTSQQRPQTDSIGRIAELISGDPMTRLDADMKHVLDGLAELGARPLELSIARGGAAPARRRRRR